MAETEEGAGRAPSGRLLRSVQTLAQWYRSPQQELMHRELAWTLRWLKSPLGLACLFAQFLASLLFWIGFPMTQGAASAYTFPLGLYRACIATQLLLTYGPWVYLYQLRAIAPFRSGRLNDLLLSDLEAKSLWPGLFVAPVAVLLCFQILLIAQSPFTGANTFFINNLVSFVPSFDAPLSYAMFILFHLVHGLFFALAISAFISCFVVPKGGVIRIVLFLIIGMLIIDVPHGIFQWVVFRLFLDRGNWGEWVWMSVLAFEFFRVAIEILVFRTCMKWLHGERFWERLRGHVEIAQPPN